MHGVGRLRDGGGERAWEAEKDESEGTTAVTDIDSDGTTPDKD